MSNLQKQTLYNSIPQVIKEAKNREWYVNEAISENWSTRALDRKISTGYYQKLLASQIKELVNQEAKDNITKLEPQGISKDYTYQNIGQMDTYIRIYEDKIKQPDDNPTIGLVLCADKNETLAKYSMLNDSKQIFASKYKLLLPTEEELQQHLNQELLYLKQQGVPYNE